MDTVNTQTRHVYWGNWPHPVGLPLLLSLPPLGGTTPLSPFLRVGFSEHPCVWAPHECAYYIPLSLTTKYETVKIEHRENGQIRKTVF